MKAVLLILVSVLLISCNDPKPYSSIKVVGQMRNVMWKGDLVGKISTDSLSRLNSYGLGPLEHLRGEVLLFEGQTFISKVIDSVDHQVTKVPTVKAPFFVYSSASDLREIHMIPSEYTLKTIEQMIDSLYNDYVKPLLVRVVGLFENLTLHTVNLPVGSSVSSPSEAHEGLKNYHYNELNGSLIGFFSRNHQSIFTHHDSFFHAHFISDDRSVMGHVDAVTFKSAKARVSVSK